MILLIKLLLSHIAGDFFFQPYKWVKAKEEKKLGAWQLYAHVALHGLIFWILVWDLKFWKWALILMVVHFIIDAFKLTRQEGKASRSWFFTDQLLHLFSIYLIWLWIEARAIPLEYLGSYKTLLFITALLLLTRPSSFMVKVFISRWTPESMKSDADSLQSAGMYIGMLERLLVFTFIISMHWEAIGFLIAAKSVFRFGDLKESGDRQLTEYVLTGTLLSFGIAILTGIIYQYFNSTL